MEKETGPVPSEPPEGLLIAGRRAAGVEAAVEALSPSFRSIFPRWNAQMPGGVGAQLRRVQPRLSIAKQETFLNLSSWDELKHCYGQLANDCPRRLSSIMLVSGTMGDIAWRQLGRCAQPPPSSGL